MGFSLFRKLSLKSGQIDCWLLTGATGLVGRFVLAELLRAGKLVAALVRDRAAAGARVRVEECLAPFETEVALLRPKTIAFDLTVPGLGVSDADRRWLSGKRLGVIHSAASIRFNANSAEDEPYLSNVVGTRNLLDFLHDFDVDCFHYVSTAYVSSRVVAGTESQLPRMEVEVPRGASGGNDYEASKIASERLISDCEWLKSKTFLRPSIIVGDSKSGYTSTFHGFYAPLQIGNQVVKLPGGSQLGGAWFRRQLGLKGSDTKNFVTVDWVARAIARVALDRSLHGGIYHLTNPRPVACIDVQTAIERSLEKQMQSQASISDEEAGVAANAIPANFREQMAVYESYFNNDPAFDSSRTQAALADLPCPRVDVELLTRLAKFALQANFGWPKPTVVMPEYAKAFAKLETFEQCEHFEHCKQPVAGASESSATTAGESSEMIQLHVLGAGSPAPLCFRKIAGHWKVSPSVAAADGNVLLITGSAADVANCINGPQTLAEMVANGRVFSVGNTAMGCLNDLDEFDRDLKHPC